MSVIHFTESHHFLQHQLLQPVIDTLVAKIILYRQNHVNQNNNAIKTTLTLLIRNLSSHNRNGHLNFSLTLNRSGFNKILLTCEIIIKNYKDFGTLVITVNELGLQLNEAK